MGDVMFLMIHLVEYLSESKHKLKICDFFNMIARIDESKTLVKHKSCECSCKYDGRKMQFKSKIN